MALCEGEVTPVMQSKLFCHDGIHSGNCYAACLASMLDLPLWMVPPFEDMFASHAWHNRTTDWLARMFNLQMVQLEGHQVDALPEFYIATGPSQRGVHHSTIYRSGDLMHDPHPSGSGIVSVDWTWHLEGIEA